VKVYVLDLIVEDTSYAGQALEELNRLSLMGAVSTEGAAKEIAEGKDFLHLVLVPREGYRANRYKDLNVTGIDVDFVPIGQREELAGMAGKPGIALVKLACHVRHER
jgi:hypothetical protein